MVYILFPPPPSFVYFLIRFVAFFPKSHRFGPDSFDEATKVGPRANQSLIDWSRFKYIVFDIPQHGGTYAERFAILGNTLFTLPNYSTYGNYDYLLKRTDSILKKTNSSKYHRRWFVMGQHM